jgi:hypothetical protein
MKKLLGAISPAYGALTGEGVMGKVAREGGMGLIPRMTSRDAYESTKEKQERKKRAAAGNTKPATTMKAGGYVKAADGCAKKGKTKGRMV